jgi:predicted ribosomally synthesized peptide with SipW-like signal peptide
MRREEVKQRMKNKVLSMFLATLLMASIIGVAYAHWSDSVEIEGTVDMGSLTFGFTQILAEWDSEQLPYTDPPKEVAQGVCELSVTEEDVHSLKTVYKVLTFTITNAYPQYWAINKFTLDNAGTIPLCIHSVTLILPPGFVGHESPDYPGAMWEVEDTTTGLIVFNLWLYKQPEDWGFSPPDHGTAPPWMFPGAYGTTTGVRQLYCNQIDPCNALPTEVCVDFKQEAEECHTYTFGFEIEAIQWNKHP